MTEYPGTDEDRAGGRFLTALAVVAAAALLLAALLAMSDGADEPATPAAASDLRTGVIVNALDGGAGELDLVRDIGVRWIREEIRWSEVEPVRGERDWSRPDTLVADAARRGIRVLPLVLESPPWLEDETSDLPRDAGAFADFAAASAARYGPGGTFWDERPELDADLAPRWFELWNEPYFEFFSTNGVDPDRYAALVAAAGPAVRAANPQARVLLAGEAGYEADDGEVRMWMEDLFAADPDLATAFDGVAVHPYTEGRSPTTTSDLPRRSQFTRIDDILGVLRDEGVETPRLWITEIGWSTCDSRPPCVDEPRQARHLDRMLELVRGRYADVVEAVFVYHLRDFPDRDAADKEGFFGLVRVDGTRKPAWDVVRRAAG